MTLLSCGMLCLWMKKNMSVPLISLVPWNRRPISFYIALLHFGLSYPFSRCLHSWYLPVSGKMTAFICSGWIVTSPVVLFVCSQYSPVLCTMYAGNYVGFYLVVGIFATWLTTRMWTFSHLDLVLYMCTSNMLHVLPPYGFGSCILTSVSYGMTRGSLCGYLRWILSGCRNFCHMVNHENVDF